ncbi:hypothetical protein [Chryseobacterium culicis]|uniref:hypothetical protein n=1 Tax=Chryseobacterium culicis TaxID=680127 RepID=UPI0011150283|nr:hypothetical protein [Chryseobacterium culicis]
MKMEIKNLEKRKECRQKKISLLLIRNMEVVQSIQVMQEVHQRMCMKKGGLEIQKIKEVKKRILGDIEHRIRKKENNYNH